MEYHVERVDLEEQPTAVVRGRMSVEEIAGFLGGAFGEVIEALGAQGLQPAGMPFACYVPVPDGFDVEAGFPASAPVSPTGRVVPSILPGGPTVLVLHKGAYDAVAAAYAAAEAWLAEHRWVMSGVPWEAYMDGPEVAEPRTIVHVPCRPV